MLSQYNHDLITSVTLWLANKLENDGQAYINTTGTLFRQAYTSGQGYKYISPYRGWVYDNCVAGASIPSGVYNSSGQFLTRASGIIFDWNHGQILSPQNWGPNLSGIFARKEVNVYFSSTEESEYVLEQVYGANKNLQYPLTGFAGRALAAPLIMLTNSQGNNTPFALGGTDTSRSTINALVITNDNWLQEGVSSLCKDTAHSIIPFCSYADAPLEASGDLKGESYNYCTRIYNRYGCAQGLYIENVYGTKISDKVNQNNTFFAEVIQFDLSKIRL